MNIHKVKNIQEAMEFADAIVNTIREPLLVLDGDLKVRSANRSFYTAFNVKPKETEGVFIYDLGNRQWDIPQLRQLFSDIIPHNTAFDDFEVEHEFPRIGKRTMLLNARRIPKPPEKPRFILIAIEDITDRKCQEVERNNYRKHLEQLVKERTAELVKALSNCKDMKAHMTGEKKMPPPVNGNGESRVVDLEATINEMEEKISRLREQLKGITGNQARG